MYPVQKDNSQTGVDTLYSDLFSSGLRAITRRRSARSTDNGAGAHSSQENARPGARVHAGAHAASDSPIAHQRGHPDAYSSSAATRGYPTVVSDFRLWVHATSDGEDAVITKVRGEGPFIHSESPPR
jgi:hypothetical protein